MKKKNTYSSVSVERVDVVGLLPLVAAGCIVALDVAKEKFVAAIATATGEVLKLVRFRHPDESRAFLRLVDELRRGADGKLVAAMEPTGVYGDGLRHALHQQGVAIHMVSPKRTHDSAEVFDGVPSMHDPKSAVIIAKLAALGLATPWTPSSDTRVGLRAVVEQRRLEVSVMEMAQGRLEALCARHWPELSAWMDVREQRSALRLLATYGGPHIVAKKPEEEVRRFLHDASYGRLSKEAIDGVLASTNTLGVPMVDEEVQLMRVAAERALEATYRAEAIDAQLRAATAQDDVLQRLAGTLGPYTAAVIVAMVDPRQYASARQLEKACGLNLREKSSGEMKGGVHLTKRGPGVVRQVLYLFALRTIATNPVVAAWYRKRRGYTDDSKRLAVVAVMRKLTRALWHVAQSGPLDCTKLFDTRRLDLSTPEALVVARRPPSPRTEPRPIARGRQRPRTGVNTPANA